MESSVSGISASNDGYQSDGKTFSLGESRLFDQDSITSEDFEGLLARNRELEEEIAKLRHNVSAQTTPPLKCGYLFKHRPWARFLERPWEPRYFSLCGNTLSFWRSDREATSHVPHGHYPLAGCVVHVEGVKKRYFVFRIEDNEGGALLRVSSSSEADGRHWVKLLESVGCGVILDEGDNLADVTKPAMEEAVSLPREEAAGDGTSAELRHRRIASRPLVVPQPEGEEETNNTAKSPGRRRTPEMKYTLRASAPAHRRPKESPLSSEAIFNQSHAGLFNLCVVVLLAVNSRLIIENLIKYGFLVRPGFWFQGNSLKDLPLLECALTLPIFPLLALFFENLKIHFDISETVLATLHTLNCSTAILFPASVIFQVHSAVLPGFMLIFVVIILWMKLISYAHTNADVRTLLAKGERPEQSVDAPEVHYPDNISVRNIVYFLVAPTLCYQLGYPRSRYVRKRWVLWQITKLVVFFGLMMFIIEQYINPTIKNSRRLKGKLSASAVLFAVERVLKLSIPTLYVWLCMFYCFFHLWLNILAEVLCFGDREFYKDWWNAKTVEEYWRLWNMPVHKWMVRHVYFPCIRRGLSKPTALFIVFTLSAVFHEVVIGIPCHMLRYWAFLGILFQIPLVAITNYLYRKFNKPMVGNMIFWFFFCIVGQPICVLLYYHDVVSQNPMLS